MLSLVHLSIQSRGMLRLPKTKYHFNSTKEFTFRHTLLTGYLEKAVELY